MREPWKGNPYVVLPEDVDFLREIMSAIQARNVAEIGCGYSTIILSRKAEHVDSFENDPHWQDMMDLYIKESGIDNVDVHLLDLNNGTLPCKYDLIFVDGPFVCAERNKSIKIVAECTDVIILHDYHEDQIRGYAENILKIQGFRYITPGGARYYGNPPTPFDGRFMCGLWRR